jgi:hypothetical protein
MAETQEKVPLGSSSKSETDDEARAGETGQEGEDEDPHHGRDPAQHESVEAGAA